MTKQHETALARLCVVTAVAVGALVVAAPAYAAATVDVSASKLGTFNRGDTKQLVVQVRNKTAAPLKVTVSVGSLNNFVVSEPTGCAGPPSGCVVNFGVGDSDTRQVTFSVRATGSPDPGQQITERGQVTATAGSDSASDNFDAVENGAAGGGQTGPSQNAAVAQISGTVRDQTTGAPLRGATVAIQDGAACGPGKCETGTDGGGNYKFTSTPGRPITPGNIQIGASKNGYEISSTSVDARAGQAVTVNLKLAPSAGTNASATPEPPPTLENPQQQPPAANVDPTAGAAPQKAANTGPSTFSWIILVLAGLLVLLGGGVFVVLFINRKKGDGGDEGDDYPSPGPRGAPHPAGTYGNGAAATMVGRPAGMGLPGMGDSATAILSPQRPEDEYPDPYAAPYPTGAPSYSPAGAGYGSGSYSGSATQVGGGYPPSQRQAGYDDQGSEAYGASQQGYGATLPGYVPQPTTGYDATTPAGYGATAPAGYGAARASYAAAPPTGYAAPPPAPYGGSGGGYDDGGGFDQPGGGYGSPAPRYDDSTRRWNGGGDYPGGGAQQDGYQAAGYAQQSGHNGGYDPRPGYDQPAGGYDAGYAPEPGGEYDPYYQQPGEAGRRSAPPPPAGGRASDRQRLDWLDD